MDLGYWDYGLLLAIEKAKGFFLSRVKSKAVIIVTAVVQGLPKRCVGQALLALDLGRKREGIIDVWITKDYHGDTLLCRAIGFWNPAQQMYHWYLTNLAVAAYIIYPLYRLRWQIELIFKACKNSLNANQITSSDTTIIESLLLGSMAAQLSTYTILETSMSQLDSEQKMALSFQRVAQVAGVLCQHFVMFLLNSSTEYLHRLCDQIALFSNELFDPNYKRRETSLKRVSRLLVLESGR